jgi:hypothetical protein
VSEARLIERVTGKAEVTVAIRRFHSLRLAAWVNECNGDLSSTMGSESSIAHLTVVVTSRESLPWTYPRPEHEGEL